jgi:hypothetical protein
LHTIKVLALGFVLLGAFVLIGALWEMAREPRFTFCRYGLQRPPSIFGLG